MRKNLLPIILLMLFIAMLAGCTEKQPSENLYSRNGITFTCPLGWTLEEKIIESNNAVVFCENDFYDSGGIFTISIIQGEIKLGEAIDISKSVKEEKFREMLGTIEFETAQETMFKDIKAITVEYNVILLSSEIQGNTTAFYCNNNTIIATFQETTEDHEKNLQGFEKIKETLECGQTNN